MRYAYIKSGDVIKELQRVTSAPTSIPDGGNDAFTAGLLQVANQQPTLLLSGGRRYASFGLGNVTARVYPNSSRTLRTFGTPIVKIFVFFSALLRLLRFRPDRILCGRRKGALLWASFIASRMLSKPLVCSCHCQINFRHRRWYRQVAPAIDQWILRRATAVICHGPYLRQQLLEIGVQASRIYEFDVGCREIFRELQESNGATANGKNNTILFIGRIQATKGIFDLLDACTDRLSKDPQLKLVYAGEGPHLPELQERVRKRRLNGQVTLLGQVPHNTLGNLLRESRFLVIPTRSSFPEGRCMAAIEGLAMGVPLIAPDFGPFPYLVQHGVNGLLFRTDSVDNLESKITRLLDDNVLYDKVRRNAGEQSAELIDPPVTFAQAIERAFASSRNEIGVTRAKTQRAPSSDK